MSLLATSLLLASFVATRATLAPEDIPASCNALIDSTGKSAVTYLANVAAKLDDDKCKQSCVSSICGASIVDAAPRFMATSTKLVTAKKAAKGTTGLRSKVGVSKSTVHAVLMGLAVPERSPGCKNKCSGHGSCLQDCRNKDGSECLQECKTYDSDLLCVCNKRCVCNADWAGEDCSQPLKCEGCNLKHGQCTNGKCLCDSGYEGTDCGARIASPKDPVGLNVVVIRVVCVITVNALAKLVTKGSIVLKKHLARRIVPKMVFVYVGNVNVLKGGPVKPVRRSNPENPAVTRQKMPKMLAVAMAFVSMANVFATPVTKEKIAN